MENNNTAGDNSENVHADQDNNNSVLMVAPVDVRSERHVWRNWQGHGQYDGHHTVTVDDTDDEEVQLLVMYSIFLKLIQLFIILSSKCY